MASKSTRYNEEQIIRILKDVEGGTSVAEVCRKCGVSEQTVYRWRSKYGGLETSELQRLAERGCCFAGQRTSRGRARKRHHAIYIATIQ